MSLAPKRVAIVAVHGISDQKPYNTAREVADVINTLPAHRDQPIVSSPSASEEHIIRIPVQRAEPIQVDQRVEPRQRLGRIKQFFGLGRNLVEVKLDDHPHTGEAIDEDVLLEKLESEYLNHQLANYDPKPWTEQHTQHYRTIRIDQRIECPIDPEQTITVDTEIYEMHWGDLSRLGSGVLLLLDELYQLLFHLASLGQHVVALGLLEAAERYPRSSRSWKNWQRYADWQEIATALISLWIPIGNLQLLLLLSITLLGKLPLPYSWGVLLLGCVAIGLLLWSGMSGIRALKSARWRWLWGSLVAVVGLALMPIFQAIARRDQDGWIIANMLKKMTQSDPSAHNYLFLAWVAYLVLALFVHFGPIATYEKRRPGAMLVNGLACIGTLVVLTLHLIHRSRHLIATLNDLPDLGHYLISHACFKTMEVVYAFLSSLWVAFSVAFISCLIWGYKVRRQAQRQPDDQSNWRERIDRCNWTAQLSLAIPVSLYFVGTMGLWSGLNAFGRWAKILPQRANWYPISHWFMTPIFLNKLTFAKQSIEQNMYRGRIFVSSDDLMDLLLQKAASPLLIVNMLLLVTTLLMIVWAFLPSIWRELNPPRNDQRMLQLGTWLDQGFRRIRRFAIPILVVNMAIIFPLGYVVDIVLAYLFSNEKFSDLLERYGTLQFLSDSAWGILYGLGLLEVLVIASALFSNRFLSSLRSVLDAILDVEFLPAISPSCVILRPRIMTAF
jgi:hypothetical protein